MNGKFISLLGLTSEDEQVKAQLLAYQITKSPKVKRDDTTDILVNNKLGIEFTFRDEYFLRIRLRDYEEGSLVLSNIRMYGEGHKTYKPFTGDLPHGLTLKFDREQVEAKLGQKPGWERAESRTARWDFKDHCVFVTFDSQSNRIRSMDVQLPVMAVTS